MKSLLLLFSFLKLGKVLTTGGTMLISVIAYAFMYGWPYAAGFIALIFMHEMGHYIAARQRGLNVGAPVFIPFVGAWIQLKDMPHDAEAEAYIGLAGPLCGSIGALGCYVAARDYNSTLLLAISYSGFFLNLFNLIPLPPFDGGRITAVLSPKIWLAGIPILIGLFMYRPSPTLILMGLIALPQVWSIIKGNSAESGNDNYYSARLETKIMYGTYYIAMLIFLALMVDGVHQMLPSVR